MTIRFIGDVHGKFEEYHQIINETEHMTIQLGDLGLGFGLDHLFYPKDKDYFIRGNHDNPEVCRNNKAYLGEYGYLKDYNMFFVSGAYSIDKHLRTPGWDWWYDEEISNKSYNIIISKYKKDKPKILIAHCPPDDYMEQLFPNCMKIDSNTGMLLSAMILEHKPEIMIFAHMHESIDVVIDGIRFVCLKELETFDYE